MSGGRQQSSPQAGGSEGRIPRLLIVDDEPLLLEGIVAALGEGADACATVHAGAALARIESGERYDAILIDTRMPGMSGFELYDRIAAMCPSQAQRVVFMTGGLVISEQRLSTLPNKRIVKPVDIAVMEALGQCKSAG